MQYIFDFQNRLWKNKLNVTVPLLSLGILALRFLRFLWLNGVGLYFSSDL